jgi:hypothetical protein
MMHVQTFVIPKKASHPHIRVYPATYPNPAVAGRVVAANADSTDHCILSEVPTGAVYCGSYAVRDIFGRPL